MGDVWKHVYNVQTPQQGQAKTWNCAYCKKCLSGGLSAIMEHSGVIMARVKPKGYSRCLRVPPEVIAKLEAIVAASVEQVDRAVTASAAKAVANEEEEHEPLCLSDIAGLVW